MKENNNVNKILLLDLDLGSFLVRTGDKALRERGIMNKFFVIENMDSLAMNIQKIVIKYLNNMIKERNITKDSIVEVEWKDFSFLIFDDIVNLLLYGYKDDEKFPMVFNERLTVSSFEERRLRKISKQKNLDMMTMGKFSNYLTAEGRQCTRMKNETQRVLKEEYKNRMNEIKQNKNPDRVPNIMDLYITHNINTTNPNDLIDEEAILGT